MGHHVSTRLVSEKNFDPTEWVSKADAVKIRGITRQAIARLLAKGRFCRLGKPAEALSEVEEFKPKTSRPVAKSKVVQAALAR